MKALSLSWIYCSKAFFFSQLELIMSLSKSIQLFDINTLDEIVQLRIISHRLFCFDFSLLYSSRIERLRGHVKALIVLLTNLFPVPQDENCKATICHSFYTFNFWNLTDVRITKGCKMFRNCCCNGYLLAENPTSMSSMCPASSVFDCWIFHTLFVIGHISGYRSFSICSLTAKYQMWWVVPLEVSDAGSSGQLKCKWNESMYGKRRSQFVGK